MGKFTNLDANESAFFDRQLEYVKAQTYDILFPEFVAQRLIPVSTVAGNGASSITYRQFTSVGEFGFAGSKSTDSKKVEIYGKEFTTPVRSITGAFSYTIQDIRAAMMADVPLDMKMAGAARRAYEQKINQIALLADGTEDYHGLFGLFYGQSIPSAAAPSGSWVSSANADAIINDVNTLINGVISTSLGVHRPNTVMLPIDEYSYIATTPRSSVSDTTILEFLRMVHPGVTFEPVIECADLAVAPSGGTAPCNIAVAYVKSPDILNLEIPQVFEMLPVQERGLEYITHCHARTAGVIVTYPKAINIIEGI